MNERPVRVRFAPSPTGYLHVGGARTALFNWLYARRKGGTFVLRIEDTDKARNTPEALQAIYDGLRWLGLEWDEGPEAGGGHGPYFQSERDTVYERYLAMLREKGAVYEDAGSIRFRSPRVPVVVGDAVCGRVEFDRTHEPDMTIRRPDGSWIFHYASVVDDIEMKISHVIRGEDHLSNTPRHIELYEALGAELPVFAHIPLILNKDGSKMSKRDAGSSVAGYIEQGYEPAAVRNYLCLLGWSPKDNREKLAIDEVIPLFDLDRINRGNASFDMDKLNWLQGEYAREMSDDRFHLLAREFLVKAGFDPDRWGGDYAGAAIATCKGKVRLPGELAAYAGFYFTEDFPVDPGAAAQHFVAANRPILERVRTALAGEPAFDAGGLETALKGVAAELGVKMRALVHPVRLAVTGATAGPSLYHLLEILGRERVIGRLDRALGREW